MIKAQPPRQIQDPAMGTYLFCLCWVAYFLGYLGRLNLSAVMVQAIAEGAVTKAQAGALGTALFFTYALGQLFSGWLGDKVSPRGFIAAGLAISGCCNVAMGLAASYPVMVVVWCVNGFSQSFLWPPMLRIFAERYQNRPRMRASIYINTTAPAGTLVTYLAAALFVSKGQWKMVFFSAGCMLLAYAAVWFSLMGRIERWAKSYGIDPPNKPSHVPQSQPGNSFLPLLFKAGLLFLCIALALQGVLKDGVTTWTPVYLNEAYKLDAAVTILFTSVIPVLNLFGMVLASWLMKRAGGEISASALLFFCCAAALLALLLTQGFHPVVSLLLLAVSTTAMMGVNTLLISLFPGRFIKTGRVATISGVLNFFVYIGSAISNYAIGALTQYRGWWVTILVWLCLAGAGVLLCILAQRRWVNYPITQSDEVRHEE